MLELRSWIFKSMKLNILYVMLSTIALAAAGCSIIPEAATTDDSQFAVQEPQFDTNNRYQFTFNISPFDQDPVNVPYIYEGEFTGKSQQTEEAATIYQFLTTTTNTPLEITIPNGILQPNLVPGTSYSISPQLRFGWPSVYGLFISKGLDTVYAGCSDWDLGDKINIGDGFLPMACPAIRLEETGAISNNRDGGPCHGPIADKEIRVWIGDDSFLCYPGQSVIHNGCRFDLLVSQLIIGPPPHGGCLDAGICKISYAVSRIAPLSSEAKDLVISFPDPALNKAVKKATGAQGPDIKMSNLIGFKDFGARWGITNLTGMEYWISLRNININDSQITDVTPISKLSNLTGLWLNHSLIADISKLRDLKNLYSLSMEYNQISDISAISNMKKLNYLRLRGNRIDKIPSLTGLVALKNVEICVNQVSDISGVAGLPMLTSLDLASNRITDISALANLPGIKHIYLGNNKIADISPLVNNPGLDEGDRVEVWKNPLNDVSINKYIPQLRARGVDVQYWP